MPSYAVSGLIIFDVFTKTLSFGSFMNFQELGLQTLPNWNGDMSLLVMLPEDHATTYFGFAHLSSS